MKTTSIAVTLLALVSSSLAFSCRCFVDGVSSGPTTGAVNLCGRMGGTLSVDGHLCMDLPQPYTTQMCLDYFRGEAGWQADCVAPRAGPSRNP